MYRRALQEIPSSPFLMRGSDTDTNLLMIPESLLTPSPDEEIIQQRSRRIVAQAVVFQYDNIERNIDLVRTPSKEGGLSQLSRKRLLLTPPDSGSKGPRPKRPRLEKQKRTLSKTEMSGYSIQQLVEVLDQLITKHPQLEKEVRDSLQQPDIAHLEENLLLLRRNVYRALPTNRWDTSRDAYTYKRVKLHIESFKNACINQGRRLIFARCWEAAIEYVLAAWKYVHQLPDWDNPSHNALKNTCFRTLAAQCMVAVKHGNLSKSALLHLHSRLESAVILNKEMQPCVTQVQKLLS